MDNEMGDFKINNEKNLRETFRRILNISLDDTNIDEEEKKTYYDESDKMVNLIPNIDNIDYVRLDNLSETKEINTSIEPSDDQCHYSDDSILSIPWISLHRKSMMMYWI